MPPVEKSPTDLIITKTRINSSSLGQQTQSNDVKNATEQAIDATLAAVQLQNPQIDIHEARNRAEARRRAAYKRQLERYKAHPWPWLCEQVLTEDPHDKSGAIKPFPQLEYLERLVNLWLVERRLLVPKSRRMLVSWTFICLHVWLMLFYEHEYIYFAARKEGRNESEGSLELVARAKFVLNNQRSFVPPRTEQHRGRIVCPSTGSAIVAIGEGANQMRQLSATAIFADEFAFWEKARETYTSARPTIEASGRFTGVSTAYPSFFKELVFDQVA